MNRSDAFDRTISDWLHADAEHRVPEHLDAVLRRTRTERQRPAWSSLERWLPVQTTLRLSPVPRVAWLLVVIALLVALAVAAVAIGSRYRQPAPPFGLARNGAIIYEGTDNDIYRLDPVTGASTALVAGSPRDHRPWLSPDGTKFLFIRDVADLASGKFGRMIMVANDDGSDVRPLTGTLVGLGMARWSNDGSMVAVFSGVNVAPALQIFTVTGAAKPVTIETQVTDALYLAFRPGDRELTFRGSKPEGDGLYAVGVDGHGLQTIVPPGQGDGAILSPDGTKLAYQTWDGTYGTIHVVDLASGNDEIPAFEPDAKGTGLVDDYPQWSPDGTRFVFTRYGAGNNHLWVAPSIGGHAVEIGPAMPNDSTGGRAEFSPDGTKVVAHFNSDGSTWLLDPTGATAGTQIAPSTQPRPTPCSGAGRRRAPRVARMRP